MKKKKKSRRKRTEIEFPRKKKNGRRREKEFRYFRCMWIPVGFKLPPSTRRKRSRGIGQKRFLCFLSFRREVVGFTFSRAKGACTNEVPAIMPRQQSLATVQSHVHRVCGAAVLSYSNIKTYLSFKLDLLDIFNFEI